MKIEYLKWQLGRVLCFLLGHDERLGDFYDPNYCGRCWIEWPQKDTTLPTLLIRALNWARKSRRDHGTSA